MNKTIDWDKPLETTDGQPAKLVYQYNNSGYARYVIATNPGTEKEVVDIFSADTPFIRNVPEPPVKLEGILAIAHEDGLFHVEGWYASKEDAVQFAIDHSVYVDLALVSERCPEAIERVEVMDAGKAAFLDHTEETTMTNTDKLTDRRAQTIAQVRCGNSFVGEYRASRIIAADPATALLAEARDVLIRARIDVEYKHSDLHTKKTDRMFAANTLQRIDSLLARMGDV